MDYEKLGQEAVVRIGGPAISTLSRALRVEFLGKQGSVSALLKTLGGLSPEERKETGPKIHGLRESVSEALAARKAALEAAVLEARLATETIDLTLPAPEAPKGSVTRSAR